MQLNFDLAQTRARADSVQVEAYRAAIIEPVQP